MLKVQMLNTFLELKCRFISVGLNWRGAKKLANRVPKIFRKFSLQRIAQDN